MLPHIDLEVSDHSALPFLEVVNHQGGVVEGEGRAMPRSAIPRREQGKQPVGAGSAGRAWRAMAKRPARMPGAWATVTICSPASRAGNFAVGGRVDG